VTLGHESPCVTWCMHLILETPRLILRQFTDITNVELGYRLRRSTWNKGYATEGSEHGEVEYALTKPEWEALTADDAAASR
jgi:hypothetical protein